MTHPLANRETHARRYLFGWNDVAESFNYGTEEEAYFAWNQCRERPDFVLLIQSDAPVADLTEDFCERARDEDPPEADAGRWRRPT